MQKRKAEKTAPPLLNEKGEIRTIGSKRRNTEFLHAETVIGQGGMGLN